MPAGAREVTQEESDSAFRLFLNIKEDLVQNCIYRPSDVKIVTGALNGLARELDPEFAPYFPETLSSTFPAAFDEYQKALRKLVRTKALGTRTLQDLVEQSLRAFCHTLDRYSDYDDHASSVREKALKKADYVGAGMTIERTAEGFGCFPFPGGPADLAGCISGDRLLEVDGKSVRGRNAADVGSMFPGAEGSTVRVKVRHASDRKEEVLEIKRGPISTSFISVEQGKGRATVRLRWLTEATVKDLRTFLRAARPDEPLTIDFRGCHGGELRAAVAVAEIFLPAGATICTIETRAGKEVFRSANATPFRAKPLIILQDKGTMSGAELVTVALVTSPEVRAESRGERSYGKGVTLSEVEVVGGGRLRYADGRIYGPHGEFWDGEGLPSSVEETRAK
ncbi:MAG: S41 family peptidase [Chthoniobacteraceae bacterium]